MGIALRQAGHSSQNSRFTVGRDAEGHWVVCDARGLVGGLFTDRAAAVHFAMEESNRIPGEVCCAPDDAIIKLSAVFGAGTPVEQGMRSR